MPFASALSTNPGTLAAVDEVCDQAISALGVPAELAVVFFTVPHGEEILGLSSRLREKLGAASIIGCVAESVVGTRREVELQPAISLWVANWSGKAGISSFQLMPDNTPDGPTLFGWPDALLEADPSQAVMLLLGDPYTFPAAEMFLPQVHEMYPGLRVHGGMASGMTAPGPVLIRDGEVEVGGAVGVLLRDVPVRSLVSQGCRPVGTPFIVTKAAENVVLELGGRSSLVAAREVFNGLSAEDKELFQKGPHLGVVMNEYLERFNRGDFLVRNIMGIDPNSGAMAITDHVRTGQTVQFHLRDAASADADLELMLLASQTPTPPAGALLFTCNGRGSRLFSKPNHDAAAVGDAFGDIPLAGLFAAGEIGPVGNRNYLHGFTASVVLFE